MDINLNKFKNNKLIKKYYNDVELSKEFDEKYQDISTPELIDKAKYYEATKLELKDKKSNKNKKKH